MISLPVFKKIFAGVAIVAAASAYFRFVYYPCIQKIGEINKEIAVIEKNVYEVRGVWENNTRFLGEKASVKDDLRVLRENFPDRDLLPHIIDSLSSYAATIGVTIDIIQPREPKERTFKISGRKSEVVSYYEIPVSFEITGPFITILRYLAVIAELQQLMVVRRIELAPEPKSNSLKMKLDLSTYFFKKR